jgi:hypothetical protein
MNYFDSPVYFLSSLRLLDPEALGNSLGGPANQIRSDGLWHTATPCSSHAGRRNLERPIFDRQRPLPVKKNSVARNQETLRADG